MKAKIENFVAWLIVYGLLAFGFVFFFLTGESSFEKRNPFLGASIRAVVGLDLFGKGVILLLASLMASPTFFWGVIIGITGAVLFVVGGWTLLNFVALRRKK